MPCPPNTAHHCVDLLQQQAPEEVHSAGFAQVLSQQEPDADQVVNRTLIAKTGERRGAAQWDWYAGWAGIIPA